jgi:hypothetical protein
MEIADHFLESGPENSKRVAAARAAALFLCLRALVSYYMEIWARVCRRGYSLRQRKGARGRDLLEG